MAKKTFSHAWQRRLARADLWPIRNTPDYYRRVAAHAPAFLVRATLRVAADRLPPR